MWKGCNVSYAASDPDHFYLFGDVYETLDACDRLNTLLGRLRRQDLLSGTELEVARGSLEGIRRQVEERMNRANLTPNAPRLP